MVRGGISRRLAMDERASNVKARLGLVRPQLKSKSIANDARSFLNRSSLSNRVPSGDARNRLMQKRRMTGLFGLRQQRLQTSGQTGGPRFGGASGRIGGGVGTKNLKNFIVVTPTDLVRNTLQQAAGIRRKPQTQRPVNNLQFTISNPAAVRTARLSRTIQNDLRTNRKPLELHTKSTKVTIVNNRAVRQQQPTQQPARRARPNSDHGPLFSNTTGPSSSQGRAAVASPQMEIESDEEDEIETPESPVQPTIVYKTKAPIVAKQRLGPRPVSIPVGFRVLISDLATTVTDEDVKELCGAVEGLVQARLIETGLADAVYSTKEAAIEAINMYNDRDLDGVTMRFQLLPGTGDKEVAVTKAPIVAAAKVEKQKPAVRSSPQKLKRVQVKQQPIEEAEDDEEPMEEDESSAPDAGEPLLPAVKLKMKQKLAAAKESGTKQTPLDIDRDLITTALFSGSAKVNKEASPANPVTFTVKI